MKRPNVLLVILDSVRAHNCGLYGHDNETTPRLTEFAESSTVYENAHAPSIHSIASHASIFSGYHTEEHRIRRHESYLDPEATIWHELSAEHDYETGLFTPNVVITEASNLDESFDAYVGPKRETRQRFFDAGISPGDVPGDPSFGEYLRECGSSGAPLRSVLNGFYFRFVRSGESQDPTKERADVYVDELLEWVDDRSGPWAACLNLMDAHQPYVPAEQHDLWGGTPLAEVRDQIPRGPNSSVFLRGHPYGQLSCLEALYDGCIRQADTAVGQLVDRLAETGALSDTLVVVTSDHGEGFGERSRLTPPVRLVDHSWGISEQLTHVPLIVNTPQQGEARTIEEPATLTRFPSVVRAAIDGGDPSTEFAPDDGVVLSSTYRIEPPGDELPIEEDERDPYFGPWRAVYYRENGDLFKAATRGDDQITLRLHDAQTASKEGEYGRQRVEAEFDELSPVDVAIGSASEREVEDQVEDRLADLGYLR